MAGYELIFENVTINNTLSLQGQGRVGKLNFKNCNINTLSLENFGNEDIDLITFDNCIVNNLIFPLYYNVAGFITKIRNLEFKKIDSDNILVNLEDTQILDINEQNYIKENIFPLAYANGNLIFPT